MATAAPSDQDLLDLGIAEAQESRPDLRIGDGDVTEAALKGGAAMCSAVIAYAAGGIRCLYFGGAKEDDLDMVIIDKLGLPRELSTRSYGTLVFSRTVAGAAGTIDSGTSVSTDADVEGVKHTVSTDLTIAVPDGAFSMTVPATASLYGSSSNVKAGLLTKADAALFDPSITVTNPQPFAGGSDSETDDAYATRARTLWQTQRRATLSALEEGARQVAGVSVARATDDELSGLVTIYVSDDDGGSNSRMVYDVQLAMEEWRAGGIYVHVTGGIRAAVVISITVYGYAKGFDVAAATGLISDSIITRAGRLKVGQILTIDSIKAAAIAPYPNDMTNVRIDSVAMTVGSVTTNRNVTEDVSYPGALVRVTTVNVVDGGSE